MYKKIMISLLFAGLTVAVSADTLQLSADYPDRYVVSKGDTLWDISGKYLAEPWRWPELWQNNPQVRNPHLIYPGDVLTLVWKDGRPMLLVNADGTRTRFQKLSPTVRASGRDGAIPAIPLDAIQQFLSRPRVVGEGELDSAPYVVSSEDQHLIAGTNNRVYVRGFDDDIKPRYGVYRAGPAYRDPDDGDRILGYEALHVGDAVVERSGDPATARIMSSEREVLIGDRLLPQTEYQYPTFIPRAPDSRIDARIISVIDAVSQVGQHQVVVVSAGERDGLAPGHVLSIFRAGQVVNDPVGAEVERRRAATEPVSFGGDDPSWLDGFLSTLFTDIRDTKNAIDDKFGVEHSGRGVEVELPEEHTGEVMIFRTFDEVSYALVMNTRRPAHLYDKLRSP